MKHIGGLFTKALQCWRSVCSCYCRRSAFPHKMVGGATGGTTTRGVNSAAAKRDGNAVRKGVMTVVMIVTMTVMMVVMMTVMITVRIMVIVVGA